MRNSVVIPRPRQETGGTKHHFVVYGMQNDAYTLHFNTKENNEDAHTQLIDIHAQQNDAHKIYKDMPAIYEDTHTTLLNAREQKNDTRTQQNDTHEIYEDTCTALLNAHDHNKDMFAQQNDAYTQHHNYHVLHHDGQEGKYETTGNKSRATGTK